MRKLEALSFFNTMAILLSIDIRQCLSHAQITPSSPIQSTLRRNQHAARRGVLNRLASEPCDRRCCLSRSGPEHLRYDLRLSLRGPSASQAQPFRATLCNGHDPRPLWQTLEENVVRWGSYLRTHNAAFLPYGRLHSQSSPLSVRCAFSGTFTATQSFPAARYPRSHFHPGP